MSSPALIAMQIMLAKSYRELAERFPSRAEEYQAEAARRERLAKALADIADALAVQDAKRIEKMARSVS